MIGTRGRQILSDSLDLASRPGLTAGLPMGATAIVATVLWYAITLPLRAAGQQVLWLDPDFALSESVYVAPLGVPAAVLVARVLWRRYGTATAAPLRGAALGVATALGSLALAALVGSFLRMEPFVGTIPWSSVRELALSVSFLTVLTFWFGLAFAGWLLLPAGALGGWYYERTRETAVGAAATERAVE